MSDCDAVREYHDLSKHRLDRYAPGPDFLDWDQQPDPFRRFAGAPRLDLPETGSADEVLFSQRCHDCHVPPRPQDKPAAAWPAIVQRMQSHRITNGMTPLSAEELGRIMGYLQRNAKDAT